MSLKAGAVSFLICSVCWAGTAVAQPANRAANDGPVVFSPDYQPNDPFSHARKPADDVLDALLRTPEAREASSELADLNREERRALFEVVSVHVTDSREVDELVLGHYPMSGADNDWFWLVRPLHGRAQVILFASGLTLEILDSKTSGYKNIRTSWSAASGVTITCIYHYDGKQYQLVHKYTKTVDLSQ